MSEQELNLVKQLAGNKDQFEAVKKFLLDPLEPQNWLPQLDLDRDDAEYGQRVKVSVQAKNTLLERFDEMERLLEKKQEPTPINQAR